MPRGTGVIANSARELSLGETVRSAAETTSRERAADAEAARAAAERDAADSSLASPSMPQISQLSGADESANREGAIVDQHAGANQKAPAPPDENPGKTGPVRLASVNWADEPDVGPQEAGEQVPLWIIFGLAIALAIGIGLLVRHRCRVFSNAS